MTTIYLSLSTQVAKSTFFMKSLVLLAKICELSLLGRLSEKERIEESALLQKLQTKVLKIFKAKRNF